MIKRIFLFLIFLTFSTSTYAQTKVSFVDLKYLINESDPGKKINKLLIELRNKENQELKNKTYRQ